MAIENIINRIKIYILAIISSLPGKDEIGPEHRDI
jgi:hypothetical protein